ncbi:MAG: hypothetical protein N3B12_07360 [Armatimonadetes bacterium]|nr:hypothetical protein [Armatimonadota bacterium]
MARAVAALVVVAVLAGCVAVHAAGWTKLGTCGFTTTPSWMQDYKRIKFNSIAFDGDGRIYATACNGNNTGASGGLTIFNPNGTKVADVDLNALGKPGAITKMVKGGDGKVYALQNWLEIHWPYAQGVNRILRINPNGTVTEIWNSGVQSDANRIGGMTVGSDGNIYWTTNGADGYWKYHFLWRYDVVQGTVSESPMANNNQGWSETHRMFDLEWVNDTAGFACLNMGTDGTWRVDKLPWNASRETVSNGTSSPGAWRDWVTATAYDSVNDILWVGGRGQAPAGAWSWFANVWGNGASPYSSMTIVDLGSGNKGLQIVKGWNQEAYYRLSSNSTVMTGAMRFKVASWSSNFGATANTLLNLHPIKVTSNAWPVICVLNGRFVLRFIGNGSVENVDLAPLDTNWHEVHLVADSSTLNVKCWWDGTKVYDATPTKLRADTTGFMCWGATTRESDNYSGNTATVVFDWVRFANQAVSPGGSWPSGLGWYLDGGADPALYRASNIMTYWRGKSGSGFFPPASLFNWHANGNDPDATNQRNGDIYWIQAIACNPADGEAWMAWNGGPNYDYDPLGAVWARKAVTGGVSPLGYEGIPEAGAQVVALGFNAGKVYAVTCNMSSGVYNVYYKTAGEGEPMTVAQIKQAYPGTRVTFDAPKLVTLPHSEDESTNYFYVEDDDRISGIKVIPQSGQPVAKLGYKAQVTGRVFTQNGEAVILASSVTLVGTTDEIKPLGMPVRSIGGRQFGLQPATLAGGSSDWALPDGLNTTGLLIRVAGTLVENSGDYFVDDGSPYPIRLQVLYGSVDSSLVGQPVIATGVSGVAWDGWSGFRVLLIRNGAEVIPAEPPVM